MDNKDMNNQNFDNFDEQNIDNSNEETNIKPVLKLPIHKIVLSASLVFIFIMIYSAVSSFYYFKKHEESIDREVQNVINDFDEDKDQVDEEVVNKSEYNERDFSQYGDKEFCIIIFEGNLDDENIILTDKKYKFQSGVVWADYLENASSRPDTFVEGEKYNCMKGIKNKSFYEKKEILDGCYERFGPDKRVSIEDEIIDKSQGCYMYDLK